MAQKVLVQLVDDLDGRFSMAQKVLVQLIDDLGVIRDI
jgi:hypothetical protein